jgi:hypothetical protein
LAQFGPTLHATPPPPPQNCDDPSCGQDGAPQRRCDQQSALFLYNNADELCTSCKSNCLAYYQDVYEAGREAEGHLNRHQECYSCFLDITSGEEIPEMSQEEIQMYVLKGGKLAWGPSEDCNKIKQSCLDVLGPKCFLPYGEYRTQLECTNMGVDQCPTLGRERRLEEVRIV